MSIGTVQQSNDRANYGGYGAAKDAKTDAFYSGVSSAAEKADEKGTGDVLGLTMLPYSDTMSYGMSAFYSKNSTVKDPVIRINCNYGGENRYFDVHVNEVNPRNASQIEMFALACYQDDQGLTDGAVFGSYTRMKAYAGNAAYLGQGYDLNDTANVNVKMDWISMLQQMAQVYLGNPQTYLQYLDCGKLASAMEKWGSKDDGAEPVTTDYTQEISAKIQELYEKLIHGDTEQTFAIGAQSFTLKEWDEFLTKFDELQEEIRKMQQEELEKRTGQKKDTAAESAKEETGILAAESPIEEASLLTAEATMCSYPACKPEEEEVRYITCYTEEGIVCRKAGQTQGYEWIIPFENKEQYEKVMNFLNQFPVDYNFHFAAHENFWRDFLNGDSVYMEKDFNIMSRYLKAESE